MITEDELRRAVDAAFVETSRGLAVWLDPHDGGERLDEEYSRVTNPAKWRIVGARADAWANASVRLGIAVVDHDVAPRWALEPSTVVTSSYRLVPLAEGALPLVVGRSRIGDVDDAGLTLGVGDPAVRYRWLPDCGCDACDWGSAGELDQVDEYVSAVILGSFRRLTRGADVIVVRRDGWWESEGLPPRSDVDRILRAPDGWNELSGTSWLIAAG